MNYNGVSDKTSHLYEFKDAGNYPFYLKVRELLYKRSLRHTLHRSKVRRMTSLKK